MGFQGVASLQTHKWGFSKLLWPAPPFRRIPAAAAPHSTLPHRMASKADGHSLASGCRGVGGAFMAEE